MLLKNLVVYRIGAHWAVNAENLETKLAQKPLLMMQVTVLMCAGG